MEKIASKTIASISQGIKKIATNATNNAASVSKKAQASAQEAAANYNKALVSSPLKIGDVVPAQKALAQHLTYYPEFQVMQKAGNNKIGIYSTPLTPKQEAAWIEAYQKDPDVVLSSLEKQSELEAENELIGKITGYKPRKIYDTQGEIVDASSPHGYGCTLSAYGAFWNDMQNYRTKDGKIIPKYDEKSLPFEFDEKKAKAWGEAYRENGKLHILHPIEEIEGLEKGNEIIGQITGYKPTKAYDIGGRIVDIPTGSAEESAKFFEEIGLTENEKKIISQEKQAELKAQLKAKKESKIKTAQQEAKARIEVEKQAQRTQEVYDEALQAQAYPGSLDEKLQTHPEFQNAQGSYSAQKSAEILLDPKGVSQYRYQKGSMEDYRKLHPLDEVDLAGYSKEEQELADELVNQVTGYQHFDKDMKETLSRIGKRTSYEHKINNPSHPLYQAAYKHSLEEKFKQD